MRNPFGLLIAALALAGAQPAFALEPGKAITQYVQDVWQVEQGLPQNSVQAILQTRDGYLWVGTSEGLVRFDGLHFTVFDKGQLSSNNVHALYEDRQGNLWIGTYGGGLSVYRQGAFHTYGSNEGLSNPYVRTLFEDQAGNLWIGTNTGGVLRFRDGRFSVFGTAQGLPNATVRTICEDHSGRLWVGTNAGGLSRLEGDRFIAYGIRDGVLVPYEADAASIRDNVLALYRGKDGSLWIGTETRGMLHLVGDRLVPYTTREGLTVDRVRAVLEDEDGNVWAGTEGGLQRLSHGRLANLTARDGLANDVVLALYEDHEKSLWVGTRDGLTRLRDGKFTVLTRKEGLSHDFATTVYQDRAGVLWIGTHLGLNRVKEGKAVEVLTRRDGLSSEFVTALHEDREGSLWVGTYQGGLNQIRDGRITHYTTRDGLASDVVTSVESGREGQLWIGTHGGVSRLDGHTFRNYGTREGLVNPVVLAVHEDVQGRLWVGSAGGLFLLRNEHLIDYTNRDARLAGEIKAIHEDPQGSLWFGTTKGLVRLRGEHWTSYARKEGLSYAAVSQILEDTEGHLWMTSARGVFRVAKADLDALDAGSLKTVASIAFDRADGMKSSECSVDMQPAGWRSRDGRLWFPTVKGVAVIDPARIKTNAQKPPVVIEELRVDEEVVPAESGLELGAGTQKFEFHYAGLSFVASDRVTYRYTLDGFDHEWFDAGTRRVAYYNSIPPGQYGFRVRACNADGVCNDQGATLSFKRKAHYYQTPWFIGLCVLGAASAGWGLYRLHLRRVKAEFTAVLAERGRIAREIHDTLAQGFVGISAQLETVAKTHAVSPDLARKHLDRARVLVRSSLVEARRSVWDLRPQALERGDLVTALSDIAQQLTAETQVRVDVDGERRRLPPLVENNLFRIGQEALTNALKHAQAEQIRIHLQFREDNVRLSVRDDGQGFESQTALTTEGHFGLMGIRERTETLGGRLTVQSQPGSGTEVAVEISVPHTGDPAVTGGVVSKPKLSLG